MIKTVLKFLFTIFIIITSIYYKQLSKTDIWNGYVPIIFNSFEDEVEGKVLLADLGYTDLLSRDNLTIGINNFTNIEEMTLDQIDSTIDINDYRRDPFILSINHLFETNGENKRVVYIKVGKSGVINFYNIYKSFSEKGVSYQIGQPVILRTILNIVTIISLLLLLSIGSRTRFVASIICGICFYIFIDLSYLHNFIFAVLIYYLVIMLVEVFSFSNRYVKRNNIGILRIIIFIALATIPTFSPAILDLSTEINIPVSQSGNDTTYKSLAEVYDEALPTPGNYFAHYAYQKSVLYGVKYMFPTYENSVTIDEFNREDYYLSRSVKIVHEYNQEFLDEFLLYCETTVLGRFYLDYGRPFTLELNSLLDLYLFENEYKHIGIMSLIIFISSLIFLKGRDKKIKY